MMSDLVQMEELAQLKEIMEDEFDMLVSMYVEDSGKLIEEISSALQNQDAEAMRVAAHTLKGSSSNMCVSSISALAKAIEDKARENNFDGVDAALADIQQKHSEVVSILQAF